MEPKNSPVDFKLVGQIVKLMEEHGLAEFEWERGGVRLKLKKTGPASPRQPSAFAKPATEPSSPSVPPPPDEEFVEITSPMVGTFYRARSPEGPPLVEVGGSVGPRTVVGTIEAMKVMNEIEADEEGEVAEVLVKDGAAVEFGQPLFRLRKFATGGDAGARGQG